MSGTQKCAHPACSCQGQAESKYCGTKCEMAKDVTELACQCSHPGCKGEQLKA